MRPAVEKLCGTTAPRRTVRLRFTFLNNSADEPMPVFIAFAAFLLLVFGHRLGLPIGPWVVTTGPFGNKRESPGQKSGVRTVALEMVLDHDSGRMEGRCLKGRFAAGSCRH